MFVNHREGLCNGYANKPVHSSMSTFLPAQQGMWTTEDCWLHMLTNDSSKHTLAQVQKPTQQNERVRRPLMDALVQVPHKTPLGTKEHWHREMQWHACKTILQTLKGNTYAFLFVNSVKLHLTAFKIKPKMYHGSLFLQNIYSFFIYLFIINIYLLISWSQTSRQLFWLKSRLERRISEWV